MLSNRSTFAIWNQYIEREFLILFYEYSHYSMAATSGSGKTSMIILFVTKKSNILH